MAIKIKTQKDHLVTEASIEVPADLNLLDALMRASKSTGRIVAVYNQGAMWDVNVEQRTRISEKVSQEVREAVGVGTKELPSK